MFGITIQLNIQGKRSRGKVLKSKVFSDEEKAINWIIRTVGQKCSHAIPVVWDPCVPNFDDEKRSNTEFIKDIIEEVSDMNLTLDQVIDEFQTYWNLEGFRDEECKIDGEISTFDV